MQAHRATQQQPQHKTSSTGKQSTQTKLHRSLAKGQQGLSRLVSSSAFSSFIISIIILAGLLVGLETYPNIAHAYHMQLHLVERIILYIFVTEMIFKILAEGRKPWRYFLNPWNIFDFVIVVASLMPFDVQYIAVLRMLRVLRVFRLVTSMPKLQLIVGALLRSIPSMGYVSMLLGLLFYIYAVLGVFTYGPNDPLHFGSLQTAMISLFQSVTMDGWSELMYTNIFGCDMYGYDGLEHLCTTPSASPIGAPIYFISFMITGSMIILNFFIGVILSAMDEVNEEAALEARYLQRQQQSTRNTHDDLIELTAKLQEMQDEIHLIATGIKRQTATLSG
jgi:voltage-gated sodium channel